jgi:hypothetical protein
MAAREKQILISRFELPVLGRKKTSCRPLSFQIISLPPFF